MRQDEEAGICMVVSARSDLCDEAIFFMLIKTTKGCENTWNIAFSKLLRMSKASWRLLRPAKNAGLAMTDRDYFPQRTLVSQ